MKIAMLGQKGIPTAFGGIERHVEELSKRLAANGHEVLVYCRPWYSKKSPLTQKISNLELVQVPSINTKNLDAFSHTLFSTVSAMKRNPDIYHYHGVGPSLLAFIPRIFRPKAKVIITFHCIDRKHQKWGFMARVMLRLGEWAACRFAHETIAVSRTLEQYCMEVYETKTNYIPNGIVPHSQNNTNLIKRFNLEPNNYISMVSRLVRHKGVHHLINAWNMIRSESPELLGKLKLAIVGDSAFTDDYVSELKTLANNDPSIVFTGYQSGAMLDELFANSLFVVHPSESEGLPIAVLEAMSYGKVVLASDIPENMEVIAEHGCHFQNGNVNHLKNMIVELVTNKHILPEMGEGAREFVTQNYHWDDITTQVEALYNQTSKNFTSPILVTR